MDRILLTRADLVQRGIMFSNTTLLRLEAKGQMPKRRYIGARTVVWCRAEIDEYLGLCLGLAVIETPALYLTCEDDTEELHWRQERLCNALDLPMADLAGKLHLVSLRGELGNELATFTSDGKMIVTEAFTRLSHTIRTIGAKIVVLDNVAHLFTGNENDRADVTRFVNVLNRLAGETGAAIILLGHPNKAGDEWSGSTAWNNAVRSRLYLEHDEETDVRKLTLPKANYSLKGQVVSFRWHDWAFEMADLNEAFEVSLTATRVAGTFANSLTSPGKVAAIEKGEAASQAALSAFDQALQ